MFVIIVRFSYIYVSQGSVKMHLWFGGMYNNHIITNFPQSVPVKKVFKSVNDWWRCAVILIFGLGLGTVALALEIWPWPKNQGHRQSLVGLQNSPSW